MRKIKVVVLLVRQLQHGFTKNAKVSPNLTVAHMTTGRHRLLVDIRNVTHVNNYSIIIASFFTIKRHIH